MAAHLNNSQGVGPHARNISTISTVDSDMIDEGGNPNWKNRVESWKDKKNKKKKGGGKVSKEVQVPVDQHIEEKAAVCRPNCNASSLANNSNSEELNHTV